MQSIFSASIKFFSTYSELIPAPRGFESAGATLNPHKWQHFPTETASCFNLDVGKDKTCHINVGWKGQTMETVRINLLNSAQTVQFTARSPAISCKYIVWTEAGMFIRRFQVSLSHDEDFARLQLILSRLKLVVKPARRPIPAPNQSDSHENQFETLTGHVKPALPLGPNSLAANLGTDVTCMNNPILDSQFQATAMEQSFQYPLYSQVVTEAPWQTQSSQSFEKAPNTHVSGAASAYRPSPLSPPILKASETTATFSTSQAVPLNYKLPSVGQIECEIQASISDPFENLVRTPDIVFNSKSGSRQDNTGEPDQDIREQLTTKTEVYGGHNGDYLSDQQLKKKDTTAKAREEKTSNNDCTTKRSDLSKNVLDMKCDIPSLYVSEKKAPKVPATGLSKQKNSKTEEKTCDHWPESQSKAQCLKVRITKKMIKERLKDEYFMKWVSKVEESLSAMTEFN